MSEQNTYSISDLAESAQVTPRTIRYYTAEGLLPPPDTRGKYARYSNEHLLRLQLIARLKEAYLPLAEIRTRLTALNADALAEIAAVSIPLNSAAEYLAQIFGGGVRHDATNISELPTAYSVSQAPSPSVASPPITHAALPVTQPAMPEQHTGLTEYQQIDPAAIREERWRRIVLAQGVEIHLCEPSQPALRHQIERLIAFSRTLFQNHSEGEPL